MSAFQHRPGEAGAAVRTFHPRRSPLGAARRDALDRLWPRWGFAVHGEDLPLTADGALDLVRLFGRDTPVVVEIGSGMGDAVAAMAAADPDRGYLAVEAHLPGVAALLLRIEELGLTNVRVAYGDAIELLDRHVTEEALDAIHVFFPDPWPKARHHKRRLIQPERVALLRTRLRVGGVLHCATDWVPYAEHMLEVLTADPGLANRYPGFAPRPSSRPVTKFERRGLELGHEVRDLVMERTA